MSSVFIADAFDPVTMNEQCEELDWTRFLCQKPASQPVGLCGPLSVHQYLDLVFALWHSVFALARGQPGLTDFLRKEREGEKERERGEREKEVCLCNWGGGGERKQSFIS